MGLSSTQQWFLFEGVKGWKASGCRTRGAVEQIFYLHMLFDRTMELDELVNDFVDYNEAVQHCLMYTALGKHEAGWKW